MMMEFCSHYVVRLILALSAQICVLQSFALEFQEKDIEFQENLHTVCWIGPVFTTLVFGSIGLIEKKPVFFGLQEEWCCTRVRSLK